MNRSVSRRSCRSKGGATEERELLEVTVRRQRPGGKPFCEAYKVPRAVMLRLTDVLEYIYQNVDPTLGFRRYLCRDGMCAGCLIRVNGQNRLACLTPVEGLDTPILLEPVPGHPVVKDLIVEFRDTG